MRINYAYRRHRWTHQMCAAQEPNNEAAITRHRLIVILLIGRNLTAVTQGQKSRFLTMCYTLYYDLNESK